MPLRYVFATGVLFLFTVSVLWLWIESGTHHGSVHRSRASGDTASIAKSIARLRMDTGITDATCLTRLSNLSVASAKELVGCPGSETMSLCTQATPGYSCYGGPYLTNVGNDPWNHPLAVEIDSASRQITMRSPGPDGQLGTSDDITFVQ